MMSSRYSKLKLPILSPQLSHSLGVILLLLPANRRQFQSELALAGRQHISMIEYAFTESSTL